jgi:hypothetical protein
MNRTLALVLILVCAGAAALAYRQQQAQHAQQMEQMAESLRFLAAEKAAEKAAKDRADQTRRHHEDVARKLSEVWTCLYLAARHAEQAQQQADAGQPIIAAAQLVTLREKIAAIDPGKRDVMVTSAVDRALKAIATGQPGMIEHAQDAIRLEEDHYRQTHLPDAVRVEVVR